MTKRPDTCRRAGLGLLILTVAAAAAPAQKTPEYKFWPMQRLARIPYSGKINENGVVAGDQYCLTTSENLVFTADLKRGTAAWQYKAKTPFSYPPLAAGGLVLAVDDDGVIHAVDGKGEAAWTLDTKEGRGSRLAFLGGRALFLHESGYFSILDLKAGKLAGRIEGPDAAPIDSWCVSEDRMYAVLRTGTIAVLGPDGRALERIEGKGRFQGPLTVSQGTILAGLEGGSLGSFDLVKKKMRWQRKLGPILRAVSFLDDKRVCVIGTNDILFCLSRRTGTLLWWKGSQILDTRMLLVWQKRTASVSSTSEIFGIDDRTGKPLWRYDLGVKVAADPQLWGENMILNLYVESDHRGFVQIMGPDVPAESPAKPPAKPSPKPVTPKR
jgi:outer membrane protein assembly factor BamB